MRKLFILTFLILISSSSLWAGWKVIIHQNQDGVQEIVSYMISKNGIKISYNNMDFVYYKAAKKVVIINHTIKSFYIASFEGYKSQLKDLMSINSKQADAVLPKSYILRFDQLLAQNISDNQSENLRTTPSLHVENSDNDRRIAEYNTQEYKVFFDTTIIEQIWLSQDIRIKDDFNILEAFNFFRGMESSSLKNSKSIDTQEYEQLVYRGFPMKIKNRDSYGFVVFKAEVVSIQEVDVDEETEFSPPAKYQNHTLIDLIMAKE